MADLDSLNIQISASTSKADSAIDALITHISKLNAAFANFSEASEYVKGLNNLTNGLSGLANAVDSIDTAKMSTIAKSLGTLATAGTKLSGLSVAKTITSMGQAVGQTESKVSRVAKELAKEWGIEGTEAVNDLTESVQKFYNATTSSQLADAESEIKNLIASYQECGDVVDETYEKVRKYLSSSSMYLPQGTMSEFGDDQYSFRGTLGIRNTTTDPTKGTDIQTLVQEMNDLYGTNIDVSASWQDTARSLYEYLQSGRDFASEMESDFQSFIKESQELQASIDALYEKFNKVKETAESTDPYAWMNHSGIEDYEFGEVPFDDIVTEATTASTAVNSLKESVVAVEQTLSSESIQNPFSGIVEGIQSLSGVNISAEQFAGVTTLASSLGKLGGSNAQSAATTIPQIASALNSLNNVQIPAISEQLVGLASGLRSLGSGNIVNAASALPQIVPALQQLNAIQFTGNTESLVNLASAIKAFGSASAQKAAIVLPQLASSFTTLLSALATAPTIKQNTIDVANAMASLANSGLKVSSMTNKASSGLNAYSTAASRASKSTKGLASTIGSLYAKFFLVIRAFRAIKSAIGYASDLTEVQNVVATTFGESTEAVQEFADTAIMSYGMSELSAKQYASTFQAMGTAMGITTSQVSSASDFLSNALKNNERAYTDLGDSMADVSINLTKLTADMASFYNKDYDDVAEDLQAVLTGMTRPLRKYGLDLTEATLKEWALKNGLDADIDSMTQAEKTMLRYQYVMANMGHVMGDFEKTADTWANATRTIGQQFQKLGQIIGQGFISAFKPAILAFRDFMNTIIDLAEKALNALGKLLGWQIEIEDVGTTLDDDMDDYADSLDDATGSASKLLKMLLPIDELNILSDSSSGSSSDSSSSSGGLSSTVTGGGLTLTNYESDIESFYEFGQRIAEKITEALNSIDWDGIYEKARSFGHNLAEFLNGSINPEEFYAIGKTIAGLLNTGLNFLYEFAFTFDWENAGLSIAAEINGFFENFDFALLADSINEWAHGIWDMTKTAISNIKWKSVFSGLYDFASHLDIETVELIISAIAIKNVGKWVFSGAALNALKSGFIKGVSKVGLGNFLFTDISTTVAAGGAATAGATIAAALAGSIVAWLVGNQVGNAIGKAIFPDDKEWYDNFTWFQEGGFFDSLFGSIKDGTFTGAIKLMWEDLTPSGQIFVAWENFKVKMDEAGVTIKDLAVIAWDKYTVPGRVLSSFSSLKQTMEENGLTIKDVLQVAFENVWKNLLNLWNGTIQPWVETTPIGKIVSVFTSDVWKNDIQGAFQKVWENFNTLWTGTIQPWISETPIGKIVSVFTDTAWQSNIQSVFENLWSTIQSILSKEWSLPGLKLPHISWVEGGASATGAIKTILEVLNLPTSLPKLNVEWYANGGYPSVGSLFVAGEAGAEMVGSIGGKTAVASNGEITGIASAIYETAAQTNSLLRSVISTIDNKEMGISNEAIFSSVRSSAKSYTMRTGASAFS